MLVFPTIKHLEQLAEFGSVAEALAAAARPGGRAGRAARGRATGGMGHVLLPGEPGYDE